MPPREEQHPGKGGKENSEVNHFGRGMPAEAIREQIQHLGALGKIGIDVRCDRRKPMFAVIAADQAQVIGVDIGAGFGRECIGQVEVGVESPDGAQQKVPKAISGLMPFLFWLEFRGMSQGSPSSPPDKRDQNCRSPQHGVIDQPSGAQQEDPTAQHRRADRQREQQPLALCDRLGNAPQPS